MDPIELVWKGVLVPALLAGVVLAVGWKAWRSKAEGCDGRWSGALALGAAFFSAFVLQSGMPASLMPDSSRTPTGLDWLAWLVIPAALLLPLESRLPLESKLGRWRHAWRGVVAVVVIRLVLRNAFENIWEESEGRIWLAGLVVLYLLWWALLASVAESRSGATSPLVLWTIATGLAVLSALTGSARIAQLSGALAAGLGAATVISWRRPDLSLSGGATGMAVLLLFGLGMNAHVFSYTETPEILLLAAAPFMTLFAAWKPLRLERPALRVLVVMALTALPIAIAITRAALAFVAETDEYDEYNY